MRWFVRKIRNYVLETLDNVQEVFRGKSTRLSQQRRQEAEHLYGNKKLEKSLLLYTQSVIRAPVAGKYIAWLLILKNRVFCFKWVLLK